MTNAAYLRPSTTRGVTSWVDPSETVALRRPRYHECAEVLAAAADDVRGGELVERIGHHWLHTT
jgi:hypothetical protein